MSNISFGHEAEKQRIYASVGCSQAQAVDWKGSSEEPGFVCLPKCCGNLAMCFWLRNVLIKIFVLLFILCLILRIIFFTTIRYKSLWSTANKLLDFGHISWFQFSTLKKTSSPTKPKAARRSDSLLTLFLFRLQAVSDQRLIYAGKLLPDNLHINGLFIQVCVIARAVMSSCKCHELIMCHYAGDKLVEEGCSHCCL